MFRIFTFIIILSILGTNSFAQQKDSTSIVKKTYSATRLSSKPVIDGLLDDEVWQNVQIATNFLMVEPGDGTPSRETHSTLVKLGYDDEAIYIAAQMQDSEPESIRRQFTQRDNLEQADFFIFDVNTYNDGENQTRFIVTAAGTIADAKMTGEKEDYSYDVVWEAETTFDENGWNAEIRIPYSALRFPKKAEQLWSIQFIRRILDLNVTYSWNYIDKSVGKTTQYNGLLTGIKDIDPPVRLSFYPYTSAEVTLVDSEYQTNFNAGLDFKYGISNAFTLDATLIPDFGQTAFDDVELNLGPFEQTFNENRAFFTEGIELFSKGNLFYSRRIGDSPIGFNTAQQQVLVNEDVIENPNKVGLLNAIKISGRTDNNLGVGFFNAITQRTDAIILDSISGNTRKIVTAPLANYNIVVLDQQFNQNSSITLINTNVTRDGHFRDGNVTGFLFDVNNKANSYNYTGEAKMSNVNRQVGNITGFASELGIERTKGNYRFEIDHELANETYDINDLGVNFVNNYNNFSGRISYQIFEPTENFNDYNINIYGNHLRRFKPDFTVGTGIGGDFFAINKERLAFGGFIEVNDKFNDFYEPRQEGQYITYEKSAGTGGFISSDYRKKFALDLRINYVNYFNSSMQEYRIRLAPRYRFSDKFSMVYSFNYEVNNNRPSFVSRSSEAIIFGNRNSYSIENSVRASYNFNIKQAIFLNFRNFWSIADFTKNNFTSLLPTGDLSPYLFVVNSNNDPNANFNIWNLDLSYKWRFAPGSEAVLLYRNSVFNFNRKSDLNFAESFDNLFSQNLRQILSLRIVYYIDYNKIKNII